MTQPHTEVLIAYKRRVNCDQVCCGCTFCFPLKFILYRLYFLIQGITKILCHQAFFEAASRDFEISTVWSQSDCHSLQEQGSSGLASSIAVGWGHNGFVGHAKGFGGGISTGDWVSGARCFVLRFCRRPVRVGTEGPVPE